MIKLINVSKKYGKKILFENVNLEIDKAGIYSFFGDNGCGKTTLLNIMSKFIKASKGKVVNKGNISFMSQKANLIPHLKIKEHFKMMRIDEKCLKKVGLYNKLDSYPFELSQGQKQRVACLLSLYSSAHIIAFDEPTSHLDSKSAEIIMKEIIKASKNKIVLLVSHDVDLINKYSTRIYKLENKCIFLVTENKTNKEIKANKKKRMKLKKYYKKSIKFYRKNSFMFWLICLVNFFMLLLTFNFNESINGVVASGIESALDYNKFYLKKCDEVEKEITFKVCDNLKESDVNKIKNSDNKLGYNYDLLMNSLYQTDKFNVINVDSIILKEGRYPSSYNEIITNDKYNIGEIITLKTSKIITMDKTDIYNKEINLQVVGIINKSIILNKDNYYLDYDLLDDHLKEEYLINNQNSLFDYFENNEFNDFKYVLYFNNINLDFLHDNNIDYLSASYEYFESIKSISGEINEYLIYLNVMMVIFYVYYLHKIIKKKILLKEDDINFFKAHGLKEKKIIKIINKENKKIVSNAFAVSFISLSVTLFFVFKNLYIDFLMSFLGLFISYFISKRITSKVVKRRERI